MQNLYLYKREMCILKETAAVKWKDICFTFCLTDIFSPNTRTFQMAYQIKKEPSTSVYPQRTVHSSTSSHSGKNKVGNLTEAEKNKWSLILWDHLFLIPREAVTPRPREHENCQDQPKIWRTGSQALGLRHQTQK